MENLDNLDILELEEFVSEYSNSLNTSTAREYFNADRRKKTIKNSDLIRALHLHVAYAVLRLAWHDDIANFNSEGAAEIEKILENLLLSLPKFARWN